MKNFTIDITQFLTFNSIIFQRFSPIDDDFNILLNIQRTYSAFSLSTLHIKRTPSKKMYVKRTRQPFWLEIKYFSVFHSFATYRNQNQHKSLLTNLFRIVMAITY